MNEKVSLLLIDDDKSVVLSTRKLIEKNFPEINIITTSTGVEGWQFIKEKHPSIVVCDISLPQMDGMQILIKIRAREELNDMYFIILTADT
ncbi:MAG: PleD family two-component system response regulator, partial [Candidatus Kapaibacterium sp.]